MGNLYGTVVRVGSVLLTHSEVGREAFRDVAVSHIVNRKLGCSKPVKGVRVMLNTRGLLCY